MVNNRSIYTEALEQPTKWKTANTITHCLRNIVLALVLPVLLRSMPSLRLASRSLYDALYCTSVGALLATFPFLDLFGKVGEFACCFCKMLPTAYLLMDYIFIIFNYCCCLQLPCKFENSFVSFDLFTFTCSLHRDLRSMDFSSSWKALSPSHHEWFSSCAAQPFIKVSFAAAC